MTELVGVRASLRNQPVALIALPVIRLSGGLATPSSDGRESRWVSITEHDAERFAELLDESIEYKPDLSPRDRLLALPTTTYFEIRREGFLNGSQLIFERARTRAKDEVYLGAGTLEEIQRVSDSVVQGIHERLSNCLEAKQFTAARAWVDLGLTVVVGPMSAPLERLMWDALVLERQVGTADSYGRLKWQVAIQTERSAGDVESTVQDRLTSYDRKWRSSKLYTSLGNSILYDAMIEPPLILGKASQSSPALPHNDLAVPVSELREVNNIEETRHGR